MFLSRAVIEQCKFDVVCRQVKEILSDSRIDMIEISGRRWIAGRLDLTPDEWEMNHESSDEGN